MSTHKSALGAPLRRRMQRHMTYVWARQRGVTEADTLALLPSALRIDLMFALNHSIVSSSLLFTGCSQSFIKSLTTNLTMQVMLPGDFLSRVGEVATELFVINR